MKSLPPISVYQEHQSALGYGIQKTKERRLSLLGKQSAFGQSMSFGLPERLAGLPLPRAM